MLNRRLTFFRMEDDSATRKLVEIYDNVVLNGEDPIYYENEFYSTLNVFIDRCVAYGYHGNLWHCAIADLIVTNENTYSLVSEMTGDIGGSISDTAALDFEIIFNIFNISLTEFEPYFSYDFKTLENFDISGIKSIIFTEAVTEKILELTSYLEQCRSPFDFQNVVSEYYKLYGVGEFSLYKAFQMGENGNLNPIVLLPQRKLDELDLNKKTIKQFKSILDDFVENNRQGNCLILGDEITRPAHIIQGVCNEYYDKGIRVIQIMNVDINAIYKLIRTIRNRKLKFIIYVADLTSDMLDGNYRFAHNLIQGGINDAPPNIMVCCSVSSEKKAIKSDYGFKFILDFDS